MAHKLMKRWPESFRLTAQKMDEDTEEIVRIRRGPDDGSGDLLIGTGGDIFSSAQDRVQPGLSVL
jgi:hypothetical protein